MYIQTEAFAIVSKSAYMLITLTYMYIHVYTCIYMYIHVAGRHIKFGYMV